MANYHILECADKRNNARVVFHISVPNENNAAGMNLRMALTQHQPVTESIVPWDIGTEETNIINGSKYEHVETIHFNARLTNSQKQAVIDSRYNQLKNKIPNILRERFKFWGLDRNV